MSKIEIKYWNSLMGRFGLFFTVLIVLCILISGYLVFDKSSEVITQQSKEQIIHTSNLSTNSFRALMDEVANDIAFLSENPLLEHYINDPSETNKLELQSALSSFLKHKPNYFQVRLIGSARNGAEIIRIDKQNNVVNIIPDDQLQSKGDKEYYKRTIGLYKGQYYFSPINLNEEFGKISVPYIPTMRAASTIQNKTNQTVGIVVINLDLNAFYGDLVRICNSGLELYIIDNSGQYLFASSKEICFGEQLGHHTTFDSHYEGGFKMLAVWEGQLIKIHGKNDLNYLTYLVPLENVRYHSSMYLVAMMEEQFMLQDVAKVKNDTLHMTMVISVVALLLVLVFTNLFSRRIKQITTVMGAYDQGEPIDVPTSLRSTPDEIGILANTFHNMKLRLDQQFRDLDDALAEKQKAIKGRDDFLQNMSHELRTPLNSILGLTQLLRKNSTSSKELPILDSLYRSTTNLSGLMYDILDQRKLEEGKIQVELKATDIAVLLMDIHATYQYDAVKKGLLFELELGDELKRSNYLTDPLRLGQVVTNLVVNALKYTDNGLISLSANVFDSALRIKVSDTGKGISPSQLANINSGKQHFGNEILITDSYGLGLIVVKQLVELFGGQLVVKSDVYVGTDFKVSIPVIETASPKQESESLKSNLPDLAKRYTIYHVEDDMPTQQLVRHVLDIKSLDLIQESSLQSFEDLASDVKPDLLISDLMIGNDVIDAEIATLIQSGFSKPILLISAFEIERIKALSPYALQKPFDIDLLLDFVHALVGGNEYDVPQLSQMFAQYDHNKTKIQKYLTILLNEFDTYTDRIQAVYVSRDPKEWHAILHKIVVHVRSLELAELLDVMPAEITGLDEPKTKRLINCLRYYQCHFRMHIYLISTI